MNNRQIIEDYYRAHRGDLLAFVSTRLHSTDEAEDVVQEAFLRLLQPGRLISEVTLPALALTLCRNLIADWYRRHTVRQDSEHEIVRYSAIFSQTTEAESVLSMREITEQMERGLARVPEECRELYRLHIYGDMPVRDISKLSGQPYKTVEYRLGLARKQVRKWLRYAALR
jgi:RNA polymerase sigma-70 factor (ECF subfamily)